jgi:TfoX/Sxy family transcriptional regulator of competence genes
MAHDEALAARVRKALAGRTDVVEQPMFGGLTFMVHGHMCCGVNRDDLIIRLDGATVLADLHSPHARVCDFTKRPMRGMFSVSAAGCATDEEVEPWVRLALEHALSQSAKKSARPAKRRGISY